MTEKEKLENGLWYDANNDAQLLKLREDADELCFQLNQTSPKDGQKKKTLIEKLLPMCGEKVTTAPLSLSAPTALLARTVASIRQSIRYIQRTEIEAWKKQSR